MFTKFCLQICSPEALKILEFCRRTRRLPYKVNFLKFLGEETIELCDLGEEGIAPRHILIEQKIPFVVLFANIFPYLIVSTTSI